MHSRQSRDAEYDAKLAEVPLRTDPIGLDRYHRKYWSFKGQQLLLQQLTCVVLSTSSDLMQFPLPVIGMYVSQGNVVLVVAWPCL